MTKNIHPLSELNPPKNITPFPRTILTGILFLLPLTLIIVSLYSNALHS